MSERDRWHRKAGSRTRRATTLCWTLALGSAVPVQGQQPTTAEVAERYVSSYLAGDVEALASFYTDHTVLADPTAVALGREVRLVGGAAIRPFLEQAFAAVEDFALDVDSRFTTGPYAVYSGRMAYTVPGATPAAERRRVHAAFTFVLEIHDGKVVSHTDYVDYEGLMGRLAPGPRPNGKTRP